MTAADVYARLGQSLLTVTPYSGWAKILLRIDRTEGSQRYNGIVLAEGEEGEQIFQGLSGGSLQDEMIYEPIEDLYRNMTQGGNNEWNVLYFTLMPGGAFEVDFVLDEDAVTARAYISQSEKMPDAKRREGYRILQRELAQARSTQLYSSISQRLPALAAVVAPTWQRITLYIDRWNADTFKLRGFAQADNPKEAEEFNVTQDWSLVKEFYQLSMLGYLPNWNKAEWTVLPDGTYSIVFDWDDDIDPHRPPNVTFPYLREGRWQEPT